jgi:hypothetical protein
MHGTSTLSEARSVLQCHQRRTICVHPVEALLDNSDGREIEMAGLIKIGLALLLAASVMAQQRISVRAGLINEGKGAVYLDEEPLKFPMDHIYEVSNGKSLRTVRGWVEVQLAPGALLWMGDRGVMRMEDSSLVNTQLHLEQGSVMIRVIEQIKGNKIRIRFREAVVEITREGLYRIDMPQARVAAYDGKAEIQQPGRKTSIKHGRTGELGVSIKIDKLDVERRDPLYNIAVRRSEIVYREILATRREEEARHRNEDQEQQKEMERQGRARGEATQRQMQIQQNPPPTPPPQPPPQPSQ